MAHQVYVFDKIKVFFKHTDYYGVVHPYNYLEWMSHARESYFQDLVPDFHKICEQRIKMVTFKVDLEYLEDARFGDEIGIKIYAEKVKKLSFDVIFEFYNSITNKVLARGCQTLTFLDGVTMRPTTIPDELKNVVLKYEKVCG